MASFEDYEKSKRTQLQKASPPDLPHMDAPDIGENHRISRDFGGNENVNLERREIKSYEKADLSDEAQTFAPRIDYEKYLPEEIREASKVTNLPQTDPVSKLKPARGFFRGIVVKDERKRRGSE